MACKGGDDADTTDTDSSSDAGLSGVYTTLGQWRNQGGCEGRGEEVSPVPYVELEQTATDLFVALCPEPDLCPSHDPTWSLQRIGADWEGTMQSGYVSEQDNLCVKIFNKVNFKQDGVVITLVKKEFRQFDPSITNEGRCETAYLEWDGSDEDQCLSETLEFEPM
jgi:hypothetical protein